MSKAVSTSSIADPVPDTRDGYAEKGERERLIELYGITQVRADYYEWGGYRYTRLEDALNYARRHPPQS